MKSGDRFPYLHDFGDDWRQTIEMIKAMDRIERPQLLMGTGVCPLETREGGGLPGYAEFLGAWTDPHHPEHRAMRQWAKGRYQPESNLSVAQARVARAVAERNRRF